MAIPHRELITTAVLAAFEYKLVPHVKLPNNLLPKQEKRWQRVEARSVFRRRVM